MRHIPLRKLLIGGWLGMLVVILGGTVALGASAITTSFLLALGVALGVVTMVLKSGAASPSIGDILHPGDTPDVRS
jgi:hypothetical protein